MPGFAVTLVVAASSASQGIEAHAEDWRYEFDRNYIPNVSRDDVGDEEVNIVGGVWHVFIATATVATGGAVSVATAEGIGSGDRFDLYLPQAFPGVEDEVVAFTVSVRLGDAESQVCGFVQKGNFGEFSSLFAGSFSADKGCEWRSRLG
jgi:hypothetical protein